MKVLVLGHRDVVTLLPMKDCVDLMEATLGAYSKGNAYQPLRTRMALPASSGLLNLMPAYLGNVPVVGAKVISVFHTNTGTPYESHQGPVLIFEPEHGRLVAMVDAGAITAIRTAAVSGAATRSLARPEADELAILGCGTQARLHVDAMCAVRPIRRVRVWSRTMAHAEEFARQLSLNRALTVELKSSVQSAVDGADIVCTTTSAREPFLSGDWLQPGVHLNAVGSSVQGYRELDAQAVHRSRVFVDSRVSAGQEADELRIPLVDGIIGQDHIVGEIGELFLGAVVGRRTPEEITLFKSLGLAVEDLAAAHHVYIAAVDANVGTWVEFSGERSLS